MGLFLFQKRDNCTEKVYFPYEDTALFVFDVILSDPITLVLNTGERSSLEPQKLYTQNDGLYVTIGEHRVKFTERSLMAISGLMTFEDRIISSVKPARDTGLRSAERNSKLRQTGGGSLSPPVCSYGLTGLFPHGEIFIDQNMKLPAVTDPLPASQMMGSIHGRMNRFLAHAKQRRQWPGANGVPGG